MLLLPDQAGRPRRVALALLLSLLLWTLPASNLMDQEVARIMVVIAVVSILLLLFAPEAIVDRMPRGFRWVPSKSTTAAIIGRLNRIRTRTLAPTAKEDEYRAALRRTTRWLYVVEGMLAEAQGRGRLSDDAIEADPADKAWGDNLYRQLGLPPEEEYR